MKDYWNKCVKWMKKNKTTLGIALVLFLFLTPFILKNNNIPIPQPKKVEYTAFTKMLDEKQVKEVDINLLASTFTFKGNDDAAYSTDNPRVPTFKDELLKKGIDVQEIDPNKDKVMQDTISSIVRMVIYVGLILLVMSYFTKGFSKKKKSEVSVDDMPKVTFEQIAGNDEVKQEMRELVEFLKKPKKFLKFGAKLPKGVILYGPPGTGKTLNAKAIAGEAGVPFFSVNGSEFVEMYVGVGAKRVRDLFENARKKAPAIIFIDEIDQLGLNRDREAHSEQKQTLNAILAEMDGFNSKDGIIVIGATNRLEDMDAAFIRPGRFDRHIAIGLPDQKGRLEILKVHAKNKPLAEDVDLESLSKMTIGLSGASLEAILNEAAIFAAVRNHEEINAEDIDDAYYKMIMKGHKKKSGDKRGNDELRLIAWHEAGHALVTKLLTDNEVPKVTIIASTSGAGGFAVNIPKKMGLFSKEELLNEIKISYGGRVAEYLLLGSDMKVTTGASQDIRQATAKIKSLIIDVGMSDTFGMINIETLSGSRLTDNESFLKEATTLSKKLYAETVELLEANKDLLQAIAEELLEKENLTDDSLNAIIQAAKQTREVTLTGEEKEA